ncbi:MAG: AAA family ATPase [Persephonella sp.]|nr:MAG: AAA family ATPase [Persephonella sp.]RUM61648.1 MAG: AAA family ATPase [Persephonella sp.]
MNYLEYYGLKEDPFKITPDYRYFYPSHSHKKAEDLLKFVIDNGEGFCLITGEPGLGKTTVIRKFISTLSKNIIYAFVLTPKLSPEEFLNVVLDDLGLKVNGTLSKHELIKRFRDFLIDKIKKGKKVLIIVDEAHNLPVETLEELRLLSNLETEKEKLVQIILLGQPELERKLKSPELRQLDQRIPNRIKLEPLTKEETEKYIHHRLYIAGNKSIKFDDKAVKKIYKYSKGIPRIINILSSRALMSAFLNGSFLVKPSHVEAAKEAINTDFIIKEKLDIKKYLNKKNFIILLLFIANTLGVAFIVYQLLSRLGY